MHLSSSRLVISVRHACMEVLQSNSGPWMHLWQTSDPSKRESSSWKLSGKTSRSWLWLETSAVKFTALSRSIESDPHACLQKPSCAIASDLRCVVVN